MGIRAVRSAPPHGQPWGDDDVTTGSAQWSRGRPFGQPDGGTRSHRSSNLCDGAIADGSGNRISDVHFEAQATRAARAALPFGQPDSEAARVVRVHRAVVWLRRPGNRKAKQGRQCGSPVQ